MASEFNSSTIIAEGEHYMIDGLNIWSYQWTDTKEQIAVLVQGQNLDIPVYEIKKDDIAVRFAAVEQSNNVWSIYHKYGHGES
ncbi:hypothetical protein [Mucilaginibacter lappiensis]|uniref:Uncharacterized protein n=1 Tax=Mucilaginibacter lappiensis TaxID=354630 RepID=A0A1N6SMY0_9SPHI|nr:hypothetical protein [Mucilaginibacter lappiensis]MBB6108324.1 hypothetical protein [Mucilaginibacter lappiensis]MBB6129949.1 hypothetical protein [Mucilaginibacter lappiensis]SIQ42326.1 hypothetical protein SAMN05421821_102439 [Mucilaginibacter lappiensis]